MTPFRWFLAVVFTLIWAVCLAAPWYSIWALYHEGYETVSQYMENLPRGVVMFLGLFVGYIIGFICGHWWWPIAR